MFAFFPLFYLFLTGFRPLDLFVFARSYLVALVLSLMLIAFILIGTFAYRALYRNLKHITRVESAKLLHDDILISKFFWLSTLLSTTFFLAVYLVPLRTLTSLVPSARPLERFTQVLAVPFSPASYITDWSPLIILGLFPLLGPMSIFLLRLVSRRSEKSGEGTIRVLSYVVLLVLLVAPYSVYNNVSIDQAPDLEVGTLVLIIPIFFILPFSAVGSLVVLMVEHLLTFGENKNQKSDSDN